MPTYAPAIVLSAQRERKKEVSLPLASRLRRSCRLRLTYGNNSYFLLVLRQEKAVRGSSEAALAPKVSVSAVESAAAPPRLMGTS